MNILFTIGKILLVSAIVFQGYNEIIDYEFQIQFKEGFQNSAKNVPYVAPLLPYIDNIRLLGAGLKIFSSLIIFTNNNMVANLVILGECITIFSTSWPQFYQGQQKVLVTLNCLKLLTLIAGLLMIAAFNKLNKKEKQD